MREALVLYWGFLYYSYYLFYQDCQWAELRPPHLSLLFKFDPPCFKRTFRFKFGLVKRVSYNYCGGIGIGISILM